MTGGVTGGVTDGVTGEVTGAAAGKRTLALALSIVEPAAAAGR